jgi:Trypsin
MRKAMIAAMAAVAVACALGLSAIAAPQANAATNADWAWPGMQYDIYKNNSWYTCSVGFPAWNSAGTRYFISAGHCFRSESGTHYQRPGGAGVEVYNSSDQNTAVGFELTYTIPSGGRYDDVSLVEMYPGKKLYGHGWQHIPDDPVAAAVGDGACLVGSRHDAANCGAVTATGVRQTVNGYPWTEDVTTASFCAHPGDSGGAVYNSSGALGIEITADAARNEPGTPGACSSSFIPIGKVLEILRQHNPSLTI